MSANGKTIQMRMFAIILMLTCGLIGHAYGFAGGTGEPNDPYQIATVDDLLAVGSSVELLTKCYVLINDLDLDPNLPGGRVFEDALIAASAYDSAGAWLAPFSGVLNGQGYTIRNLCISREQGTSIGLMGWLSGLVKDLHLQDVRISGSSTAVGAIAGCSIRGTILRCSATGQVSGATGTGGMVGHLSHGTLTDCRTGVQVSGTALVGGLFGSSWSGMVSRCEAQGEVRGDQRVGGLGGDLSQGWIMDSRAGGVVVGADYVGGLVGYAYAWGYAIFRCAATCEVVAEHTAGGLIGNAHLSLAGLITDCYARGSVTGSPAGGLAGIIVGANVLNSYTACEMIPVASSDGTAAVVGGLFGEVNASSDILVDGCFWDSELSAVSVGAGSDAGLCGTGLTTEQMQQGTSFEQAGWDFKSTWAMAEDGYPLLQWEVAVDAAQEAADGE